VSDRVILFYVTGVCLILQYVVVRTRLMTSVDTKGMAVNRNAPSLRVDMKCMNLAVI